MKDNRKKRPTEPSAPSADLPQDQPPPGNIHEEKDEVFSERIRPAHEDRTRERRKLVKRRERINTDSSEAASIDATLSRIVRAEGAHFIARTPSGEETKVKTYKGTSSENENATLVAVGDRVRLGVQEEGDTVINHVERRRTKLSRRAAGRRDVFEQVIVANVDLLVIVASVDDPPLRPGIIDRYVVAGLQGGLENLIVINKTDLASKQGLTSIVEEFVELYASLGYTSVGVSATDNHGLDPLRDAIVGRTSVFAGHSGVGKSTLVNALLGSEVERTGELQRKFNKGAHTTTSSSLHLVPGLPDTFLVDTPGVREFANFELDSENLKFFFAEFLDIQQACKIPNCSHLHEPGCAVMQAVEDDEIHVERYNSYTKLYEEAKTQEKRQLERR